MSRKQGKGQIKDALTSFSILSDDVDGDCRDRHQNSPVPIDTHEIEVGKSAPAKTEIVTKRLSMTPGID
jgi:hypothetical protein